jgi:hypothetical protein
MDDHHFAADPLPSAPNYHRSRNTNQRQTSQRGGDASDRE